jgi:uncharacterized protein YegL
MANQNRMTLMVSAAKNVIKGLSFFDFVGIVTFSDSGQSIDRSSSLQAATGATRDALTQRLDALSAGGGTNMQDGFEKGFGLIESSLANGQTSGCHNAMIFLTDGKVSDGASGAGLAQFVRERNGDDIDARLFTYAFGDDAERATLKQIACENKGIFTPIPDGSKDLREKMGKYYEYFAVGVEAAGSVWAEPFEECCGMGQVTVASRACYDRTGDVPLLIGVAGSSVPIANFSQTELTALLEKGKVSSLLSHGEENIGMTPF